MNVLWVGAPAPASLSSSALHFRLKVTNILPPSPIYHSRTVYVAAPLRSVWLWCGVWCVGARQARRDFRRVGWGHSPTPALSVR